MQGQLLFYEKADLSDFERTLTVVNVNCSVSSFMRREDVLVECTPHRRMALIDAAACLDV